MEDQVKCRPLLSALAGAAPESATADAHRPVQSRLPSTRKSTELLRTLRGEIEPCPRMSSSCGGKKLACVSDQSWEGVHPLFASNEILFFSQPLRKRLVSPKISSTAVDEIFGLLQRELDLFFCSR